MSTATGSNSTSLSAPVELVKSLRLLDCTTIVMGSMIGSGIFIVSADVARQTGSSGLFILAWVISGVMTVSAAITYGELAAMMPRAGGQYVYLREAFGPLFGFLYGWTLFLVIQTGTIAAVGVAFGKFLGVFVPWVSSQNFLVNLGTVNLLGRATALTLSSEQLIGILAIAVLSLVNVFGIRTGALVQNIFTVLKTGALLGLVGLGLWWISRPVSVVAPSHATWQGAGWNVATLTVIGVALVGPLFSSDAWNNVTFTGAEVVNAKRNLPLALFLGTTAVCALYVACNWVYLRALPFYGSPGGAGVLERGIQYAAGDRVGTAAMQAMLGNAGSWLMAAAIMISTFGCLNGLILAGARVYYAMAKDRVFFPSVARVNPKYHTPAISLLVQALWAGLLTLSGTYSELLDYVIFAVVLFYILTIAAVFQLRRSRPDAPRPYRAWGYPVLPLMYIAFALFIEWALITHKAMRSVAGLSIVLAGIPAYYLYTWWHRERTAPQAE
jgi:basic amino acid/polyamine antiporter, APA family